MARRTCFKEQYYTGTIVFIVSGETLGNLGVKLYMILWRLLFDISGFMNSFGLALFFEAHDSVVLLHWIAAGLPGQSI